MQIFYYHGGPGLNSNPEKKLLTDSFQRRGWDIRFWNEPSRLRPAGYAWSEGDAFKNYLESAAQFLQDESSEKVVLMGHSFGCHAVTHLSKTYPEKVLMCVFVGPDLALESTDKNMFGFTLEDYRESADPAREELEQIVANHTGIFDESTLRGFQLVVQNPRLFDHYWVDHGIKETFLQHYNEPEYGLDLEGFFAVRKSWYAVNPKDCDIPAAVIFGKHDIVITDTAETEILKGCYSRLTVHQLENSAHYPHVEETDRFFALLEKICPANSFE